MTGSAMADSNSYSWYCKRSVAHSQPELGKELRFVDDYEVIWIDKSNKLFDDNEKKIYLTFDAGYENGNIERILDVLKAEDVKACFFILDNLIIKNEALIKRMITEGHTVGNHTLRHRDMTKMANIDEFANELEQLENLYEKTFGIEMEKYYRPPEGKFNEQNLKWAKDLGYKTVMWSFAYADWDNDRQPSREYATKKILDNLHNGEIMLLHPTSKTNADILQSIIREIKSKGFKFGTLSELCKDLK